MYSNIKTCAICGMQSFVVQVEVDVSKGLPYFEIVGYVSTGAKEAKERIKVALKNSGVLLPPHKITINLSPANIRKDGTLFDLPMAIGILQALGISKAPIGPEILFLGELGLQGEVRGGKGVLPMVINAKEAGIKTIILPYMNEAEARLVDGIEVVGVETLREVLQYLEGKRAQPKKERYPCLDAQKTNYNKDYDFATIIGQETAKEAAMIAAAGAHHLMLIGPPGVGKTMIAQGMKKILPELTQEEKIEISKVYSVAGKLTKEMPFVTQRPFINPHRNVSLQAFAGGGKYPLPGAISLAHKGVLFLDEFTEFPRNMIEVLRQPLELKEVEINRMYGNYRYPADFMLVAAMNPCPCGYYPNLEKCTCTSLQRKKYMGKISGPIMDRIDLCVHLEYPKQLMVGDIKKENQTQSVQERVIQARMIQKNRYENTNYQYNAHLKGSDVERYCVLGVKEKKFIEPIIHQMEISMRGYHRVLKVARTIADLNEMEEISISHLSQAICLKMKDL